MMKKFLRTMIAVLALVALAVNAFAETPLWKEAAEKIAPLEAQHGYYEKWKVKTKVELVQILSDVGELSGKDVEKVLNKKTKDKEKNKLCDKLMKDYVGGSIDIVTLESIIWGLHGENWSMEDKVWYNELLKRNDMPYESETNYALPHSGELTEKQAVERARNFLMSQGITFLDQTWVDALMEEESEDSIDDDGEVTRYKGQRTWSILFTPDRNKDPYISTCHVDMMSTGEILNYHIPGMEYMFITGLMPDENAIPEDQALAIGKKAIADALGVSESDLGKVKVFFGRINIMDGEEFTRAQFKQHVWCIHSETLHAYAMLSPGGNLIEAKKHGLYIDGKLTPVD